LLILILIMNCVNPVTPNKRQLLIPKRGNIWNNTECFTTLGHNCRRWFPRSMWSKNVHINMCPNLDGYGVMTVFSFPYTPSCEPRLSTGGWLFLVITKQRSPYLETWEAPKQLPTTFQYQCVVGSSGRWADRSFHLGRSSYRRGVPRDTRAVHNGAAACVAAGGGIFENQF
jgi:hypothetical protein